MESRDKALENAEFVAKDMESRKLREAAKCLREGIGETTTYLLDDYPVVPEFLRTLVFARPRGDDQFADCTFSPSLDMSR